MVEQSTIIITRQQGMLDTKKIFEKDLGLTEVILEYIKNKYLSKRLKIFIAQESYNSITIIKKNSWKNRKKILKFEIYSEWERLYSMNSTNLLISELDEYYLRQRSLIIHRPEKIYHQIVYSSSDYFHNPNKDIMSRFIRLNEIFLNCKIFPVIDSEITKFLNEGNENKRFFDFFNFSLFSKRKI